MEVSGKIKVINPEQQVTASFRKRELVVATDEQYPQHILIEFNQDKCDLLNGCRIGEEVKVSINLQGREWISPQGETKYFNSIKGWRIEKVQKQGAEPNTLNTNDEYKTNTNPKEFNASAEEDDDPLPF